MSSASVQTEEGEKLPTIHILEKVGEGGGGGGGAGIIGKGLQVCLT